MLRSGALKVLFVCSILGGGGAERFVSTVLGFLDRSDFAPTLCLFRREIAYPLPDDVPLVAFDKRRPWHIPPTIVKLARLIDETRPDVVLSAFTHPSFITGNALILARHRPRWIARVSSNPDHTESGLLRLWMSRLYRRADLVLANSRALCERFASTYPGAATARYLPNAIDFDRLDGLAGEAVAAAAPTRRRLISVGRLEPVKRFDLLLEAMARLGERFDLELVVCGEGAARARLENHARHLGLSDRVRWPGFVENPYAWLAGSDLFVLSSDTEGLPNALIEAQGLGLAAVATDCLYGPREIVDDGDTGTLVPTGDVDALTRAIGDLLSDDRRRRAMGEAARTRTRERYGAEAVTRRLEAALREVSER
jgi:glycosyltransferase involved in cell wall biosynthesis